VPPLPHARKDGGAAADAAKNETDDDLQTTSGGRTCPPSPATTAEDLGASADPTGIADDLGSSSDVPWFASSVLLRKRAFESAAALATKSPPSRPTSAKSFGRIRSTSSSLVRPPLAGAFSLTSGHPPLCAQKSSDGVAKAVPAMPFFGMSVSSTPPPSWPPPFRAFSPTAVPPLPHARKDGGAAADAAKNETDDDLQTTSGGRTCPPSPATTAEDLGASADPWTSVLARARVFERIPGAQQKAPKMVHPLQAGEADDSCSESASITDSLTSTMSPEASAPSLWAGKPPPVPHFDLNDAAASELPSIWR